MSALAEVYRNLPGYHDDEAAAPFARSYIGWAPGDDYMGGEGWRANLVAETWGEFYANMKDSDPDLNVVADFYFSLTHDSAPCTACDQTGYNPATREIADGFYDFAGTGDQWNDKITQDEVDALAAAGRLSDVGDMTAEAVNAWQRGRGIGHDAINRSILVRTRAKRLGVYGLCPQCEGEGFVTTGPERIELVMWMLHPRKGCGRGWTVRSVAAADLPDVREYLRGQIDYHRAARFAWAVQP